MVQKLEEADVVVAGGGTAAFVAAVAAKEAGARRVVMLEKAEEREAGGNARFTNFGFRFVHQGRDEIREFLMWMKEERFAKLEIRPYGRDQFLRDLMETTQGKLKSDIAERLVNESNAAMRWLLHMRHEFEPIPVTEVNGKYRFNPGQVLCARGGGVNMLLRWRRIAQQMGVEIRYSSKVVELSGDEAAVREAEVEAAGERYRMRARGGVVLAAGGFQANGEMRAKHLRIPSVATMKIRGSRHDTGEVLESALQIGGRAAGHWENAHVTPISATAPDVEGGDPFSRYSYVLGITVNVLGERFFDEGEAESGYTYAKTGRRILEQPEGRAFQIFDSKLIALLRRAYVAEQPVQASSVAELGVKLGIDPERLTATVAKFNDAVREDVEFGFPLRDGKGTVGVMPRKSNWATKLDTPPYYAFPVTGGITFTFGGLDVDAAARVLDGKGAALAGLYAVGDIMGIFHHNYPSFSGSIRNAVFGRIAGTDAARRAVA